MTPRVTYENEIIVEMIVENSTLGANILVAGTSLPTFGSRKVETTLRLRDGESHLLAGLLREEDRTTFRGFPGMSQIPLLRRLFGDSDEGVRTTDIVMLLTPRIVRGHELTQGDLSPIHIGTQTNFGLTGPPPDAGIPDTPEPDAADAETGTAAETVPDVPDADPVPPEPTPRGEPAPGGPATPEPDQPAAQVLVTPPGVQFRVGGGPYTVPVSITGVSQLSTISLTLVFDPNILRVRTVQEGSFLRQGGVQVTFTQQVDTAAGRIDITATRMNDPTGAAGTGLLAAVLFDAIGVGSVSLSTSGTAMTPGGAPLALQFTPVTVSAQ